MKKNSKGFTLIELLAVIVILAIIALIATPVILNIIQKARKSATQDSAYSLRKAAEYDYITTLADNGEYPGRVFECKKEYDNNGKYCKEVVVTEKTTPVADADKKNDYTDTYDIAQVPEGTTPVYLDLDGTNPIKGLIQIQPDRTMTFSNVEYSGFKCTVPASGKITCE